MTARWDVELYRGLAGPFHQRPLPSPLRPTVWRAELTGPALVLGSTQGDQVINRASAERAGWEVCQRRSGGGLVSVVPGSGLWVDVLIPADDHRWVADVGEAFLWLGSCLKDAIDSTTAEPEATAVHTGPLKHPQEGRSYCFSGLGSGEVTIDGSKIVGLSQRRTRNGVRFQALVVLDHDPSPVYEFGQPTLSEIVRESADRIGWPSRRPLPSTEQLWQAFLVALEKS